MGWKPHREEAGATASYFRARRLPSRRSSKSRRWISLAPRSGLLIVALLALAAVSLTLARSWQLPADCRIKGNISRGTGERIYHLPGDAFYREARVTLWRGERWFCTEAEARAAGWRRARV